MPSTLQQGHVAALPVLWGIGGGGASHGLGGLQEAQEAVCSVSASAAAVADAAGSGGAGGLALLLRAQSEQRACGRRKNANATNECGTSRWVGGGWQCRMLIALVYSLSAICIMFMCSPVSRWYYTQPTVPPSPSPVYPALPPGSLLPAASTESGIYNYKQPTTRNYVHRPVLLSVVFIFF